MLNVNYVLVTVNSGRNIRCGKSSKSGKPDAFVVIQLGQTKFRTSVIPKTADPTWNEDCDFFFNNKYSTLTLTVYQKTFFGFEEFLGQIRLPIDEICELNDERPRSRWYPLKGKSGRKDEHKYIGELQIKLEFDFKPNESLSSNDLSKIVEQHDEDAFRDTKKRRSLLDHKRPKDFLVRARESIKSNLDRSETRNESATLPPTTKSGALHSSFTQSYGSNAYLNETPNLATAVVSSSNTSLPLTKVESTKMSARKKITAFPSLQYKRRDRSDESAQEVEVQADRDFEPQNEEEPPRSVNDNSSISSKIRYSTSLSSSVRTLNGPSNVELIYESMSKQDLIELVRKQRIEISCKERRMRDMEDYIDQLLVRVLNSQPLLLQGPFSKPALFKQMTN